ncbi:uncharacterized protein LOC119726518 [Patiria miniata]|uniref:C1q domain-containing protein n=1 Tax=Patiria miniata TaxID=46514 RepID=A0A913ZSL4_PATMI|nr:uncharacterized protein LOC119726518 [Patiria miniata]XP_038054171.1 uncharacterized protein LOC119726518 [Patiria miniata]
MAVIARFSPAVGFAILLLTVTVTDANLRYLRTVAFSAQRTQRVLPTTPEQAIGLYNRVVRPDANHFDEDSGVFTAPIKGVYALAFTFHEALDASDPASYIKLVRESSDGGSETDVVATESSPPPASGSSISVPGASVMLELEKGDKMYLATTDAIDAEVSQPISFSGYLLTRIV